jgi:transketolase
MPISFTGRTRDVCCNEPLDEKFRAFGWDVRSVDGHSLQQLTEALAARPAEKRPLAVIANTIKGRGVSFMEDVAKWHHGVPSDAEYAAAMKELDDAIARMPASPASPAAEGAPRS